MIPLSIHLKQGLTKLVLPFLFVMACLVMLIGQAKPKLVEAMRLKVTDFLAPGYALIEEPFNFIYNLAHSLKDIQNLSTDNKKLKEENLQLRRWYHVAMGLSEENIKLKNQLHWIPEPKLSFVTTRVVADVSGVYHKAILVILGEDHAVNPGQVVLDGFGLIGRVTEVGNRSARILLINDDSSRIPIRLSESHAQAIMAGDNSLYPRLIFYPEDKHPIEGEKVLTEGQGDTLPAGIPIGYVHYIKKGQPVVVPYLPLDHLRIVRIVDYGNKEVTPPDAPGRITPSNKRVRQGPVASPTMLERDEQ
ncbi:Cell shape-determining protein MreC (MreC) (PDB:2J5U) [Commensalibacter communis]|uniref:rod shape-determining protein MreC n=1 Tax=Commensalibacter communis TaxID=2972786 RepID=UPI0022FF6FA4|nr:rod shape-determining protein MreC [Commensalibacter communis]CAI3927635.1 Cell shape-determining protein MreC (MreC) (PDB:2J5U) [Commensalibacter communis]